MLIRNDHLPAGERFEYWREMACQVRMAPVEVQSDNQAGFRFALRYADLGAARVSLFTVMPYRVRRTPALIRRSDPERLSVGMLLRGHGIAGQSGRQAHFAHGHGDAIREPCSVSKKPHAICECARRARDLDGVGIGQPASRI